MATWADVERLATALPEVQESPSYDGVRAWKVRGKLVVWERPLRAADLAALGAAAPTGVIVGVRVPDLDVKEERLAQFAGTCFVTPHFDGYPAILVQLELIEVEDLEELIVDSWVRQAPKRVVQAWRGATS
jgi:hypothetical protein